MARSHRYDSDDFNPAAFHSDECDDCGHPLSGNGSFVQDADGYTAYVCRPCARFINASLDLTVEVVR